MHAGQSLTACHAAKTFDIRAEITLAKRPVRTLEVALEFGGFTKQQLVTVVAVEQLVGAFARDRYDKPVPTRLSRQTEQWQHAETAHGELDVLRKIRERLEKIVARGRDDARLETLLRRKFAHQILLVDLVDELLELDGVRNVERQDCLDERRVDAAGQENRHGHIGNFANPARVLEQLEELFYSGLFVVNFRRRLGERPPRFALELVGRGTVTEVLTRTNALDIAEGRVFVEVELERTADRNLAEVEIAHGLELGSEAQASRSVRVKQGFFAHTIARQEEFIVVPNGEREHAVEALQARRSPR